MYCIPTTHLSVCISVSACTYVCVKGSDSEPNMEGVDEADMASMTPEEVMHVIFLFSF